MHMQQNAFSTPTDDFLIIYRVTNIFFSFFRLNCFITIDSHYSQLYLINATVCVVERGIWKNSLKKIMQIIIIRSCKLKWFNDLEKKRQKTFVNCMYLKIPMCITGYSPSTFSRFVFFFILPKRQFSSSTRICVLITAGVPCFTIRCDCVTENPAVVYAFE